MRAPATGLAAANAPATTPAPRHSPRSAASPSCSTISKRRAPDRAFFGHPRGLAVLVLTEGWVSFSFYGMQSLLVLYMTSELLRPGHLGHVLGFTGFRSALSLLYGRLSGEPLAAAIVGLYSALIWATPILGGLLADRLLGRTRVVLLGALLLSAGHLLMGFEASFLVALACLILGMGCAGSINAQVGALYATGDPRRADGFQIFSLSAPFAVIAAPLICGTLGERVAWHWGFTAAATGMLIGLATYLLGRSWLPPEPLRSRGTATRPLAAREWRTVAILLALLPVLALASVGNMEIFNGYLIWAKASYALVFFGRTMSITWLLSLDSLLAIPTTLLTVWFWRWRARHGSAPDEIVKMAIGAAILAVAPLILSAASWNAGGHKVGLGWAVAFHLVNNIGFANLYAVGMALYSRAAPANLSATLINAFVLHLFLANLLVGWLAGLLEHMPAAEFWLLHAGLIAVATGGLLLFALLFRRVLAPGQGAALDPFKAEP